MSSDLLLSSSCLIRTLCTFTLYLFSPFFHGQINSHYFECTSRGAIVLYVGDTATAAAALQRQKNKDKDNWYLRRDRNTYEEFSSYGEVKIAAGEIAKAIGGAISAVASGGALSGVLTKQLTNVVVNAGWSSMEKEERVVKQIFDEDVCIFLEITKSTKSTNKELMGSSTNNVLLSADTKFSYMKAKTAWAKTELRKMQNDHAEDTLQYINGLPGWSASGSEAMAGGMNGGKGGGKIDRDRAECLFCQRSECHIL